MFSPSLTDVKKSLTSDKRFTNLLRKQIYAVWIMAGWMSISMPFIVLLGLLSFRESLWLTVFYFPMIFIGCSGLFYIYIRNVYVGFCDAVYIKLEEGVEKIDDFDEILQKNMSIAQIRRILKIIGFFDSIFFRDHASRSIQLQMQYILHIAYNLRSDLINRLEEQEKTLEQAKSEVEKNITGTSELEQVSELQKARLDRQIEQFEELQRILMKV